MVLRREARRARAILLWNEHNAEDGSFHFSVLIPEKNGSRQFFCVVLKLSTTQMSLIPLLCAHSREEE